MTERSKRRIKRTAEAGARTVGDVIKLILKIIGTVLLIGITSGVIFACIFAMYVKTHIAQDLTLELEAFTLSESSVVYYYDEEVDDYVEWVTLHSSEYRILVDYEDIPLDMEHAVVAIEDKRFYTHDGVDWYRTAGALSNMFFRSRDTFGGSTITQQLIKNITGKDEVTVERKLREIFQALDMEKNYEKDEILTSYLNTVYFGHGCYGVGAAAKYYFGKEVSDLTLAESACIVGITNNPSLYSPFADLEANKERQEDILWSMWDQGYIDEATYRDAIAEELVFDYSESDEEDTDIYPWFVEALLDDVIDDLAELKNCTTTVAETLLLSGGYKIYATVDMDIQNQIDLIYEDLEQIPYVGGSSEQIQSAIVIIDQYTGNIVGLSGGVGEKTGNLWFNRATDAIRPPGSTIKPIAVYGPAIEYGFITPETKFEDSEWVELNGTSWMTRNDDWKYSGVMTVAEALRRSINTVSAQIVDMMTPQLSYDFLINKMGITSLEPEDASYAPMALGQITYGISVREMTSAFTTYPNAGKRIESRTYSAIYDSDWNIVYENTPDVYDVVSDTTAYWMNTMLRAAATYGTGYEANFSGMTIAGKTGTSDSKKDRWFIGYTPYYTAAVWTGFDTPAPMSVSGNPAAQLWRKVMEPIHYELENVGFFYPESTWLPSIPGVDEVELIIRGVTETGEELWSETESTVAGREWECEAQVVQDYTLIGEPMIKFTTVDPEVGENIVEFVYRSNLEPEIPDIPVIPNPDDPNYPGVTDPYDPDIDTPIVEPDRPDWME